MSVVQVELVDAERSVWFGDVTSVSARSTDGELGILPGRAPVLAVLLPGEVRITNSDGPQTVTVDGGYLSVDQNVVTIVAGKIDGDITGQEKLV